jgi:membrane-associated phospholipid phosphatase
MSAAAPGSRRERLPRPWLGSAALTLAVGFLLLALLVATGALSRLDNYAAAHLMPGLEALRPAPSLLESIVPWSGFPTELDNRVAVAADVVTFPAGALLSTLAVLACACALGRRLGPRAAFLTLAAFALGNLVELLLKATLQRPAVYGPWHGQRIHLLTFDSSYPSGHSLRGLFLAGTIAILWPRARPFLAAWLVALLLMLELGGFHTPSDIAGGVLLSGSLLLALVSLLRRPTAERAHSPGPAARSTPAEVAPLR